MLARNELAGPGGDRGLSASSNTGGGIAALVLCRPSSSYENDAAMKANTVQLLYYTFNNYSYVHQKSYVN